MIAHVLLYSWLSACPAGILCEESLPDKEPEGKEYELVWSDEFNENGLPDTAYWGYDEGYLRNQELQDYKKADRKYARVEDGKLIIEAHKDSHDGVNPWTGEPYHFEYSSAELRSSKAVKVHYGRLDVCAKIPLGREASGPLSG